MLAEDIFCRTDLALLQDEACPAFQGLNHQLKVPSAPSLIDTDLVVIYFPGVCVQRAYTVWLRWLLSVEHNYRPDLDRSHRTFVQLGTMLASYVTYGWRCPCVSLLFWPWLKHLKNRQILSEYSLSQRIYPSDFWGSRDFCLAPKECIT